MGSWIRFDCRSGMIRPTDQEMPTMEKKADSLREYRAPRAHLSGAALGRGGGGRWADVVFVGTIRGPVGCFHFLAVVNMLLGTLAYKFPE